jgi:hypothetical protein
MQLVSRDLFLLLLIVSPGVAVSRYFYNTRSWQFTSPHRDRSTASASYSSSYSSYRNLERFVLQELDRHHSRTSTLTDTTRPAVHSAAASTTPRGGGNISTVKGGTVPDSHPLLHSVTHSFWTSSHVHATATTDTRLDASILHTDNRSVSTLNTTDSSSLYTNHHAYAKQLQNRNSLNINRKLTHATFGLLFATLNLIIPRATFIPTMSLITSAILLMELVRYKKRFSWINDVLHFMLGKSLRKHEMEGKFTGSFYYFLGVTLTSYLFPTSCASLGICQLALAGNIHIIGIQYIYLYKSIPFTLTQTPSFLHQIQRQATLED